MYEGFAPFSNEYRVASQEFVPPVFAYARNSPSITGGYVYRGTTSSPLDGQYICGDYESRRLFAVTQHERCLVQVQQMGVSPQRIASFAEDQVGNIYVCRI